MMQENLKKDQINRIWEYRANCVNIFYQRLNFFLIFESILLGVIGLLSNRPVSSPFIVKTIAAFGLAITLIWWYSQARQRHLLSIATTYAQEAIPEYRELLARMKKEALPHLTWDLLAHVIPVLVLLLWAILLIIL